MRIIAAFFVVMIHVSGIASRAGIFYDSIARFSVPVFVIISGYYMLARPVSCGRAFQKAGRLILLMLIWAAIYLAYGLYTGGFEFTGLTAAARLSEAAAFLFTRPVHLWYMYAAAALYIFTPCLYVFCKNATKAEYIYGLCLCFVLGCVVTTALRSGQLPLFSEIMDKSKAPYLLGFIFLYLFGGYIGKYGRPQAKLRRVFYILGILGVLATIFGTLVLTGFAGEGSGAAGLGKFWQPAAFAEAIPADLLLSFFAPNVVLAATAFFLALKKAPRSFRGEGDGSGAELCGEAAGKSTLRLRSMLHELSGCTLGIYLMHPLILRILQDFTSVFSGLAAITYIPLMTGLVYILALVTVILLRRVPVIKRIF